MSVTPARQLGEVYHLSLIAVGPRHGTEQFSAFISAALEENLGAAFSSKAIFLRVFISSNCGFIVSLTRLQGLRQRRPWGSSGPTRRDKRGVGGWEGAQVGALGRVSQLNHRAISGWRQNHLSVLVARPGASAELLPRLACSACLWFWHFFHFVSSQMLTFLSIFLKLEVSMLKGWQCICWRF